MNQGHFFSLTFYTFVFLFTYILISYSFTKKDYDNHNDPHEYAHLGKSLWSGEGLRYNNKVDVVLPPGLPIAIGAVDKVIDNLEWSGKIISIVSFFLSLFFLYKIAFFFICNKTYAWLSILLFSTNSNVLINATNGYSDSLFTFLFLTLVWLTIYFRRSSKAWSSGLFVILWSALYYVRPEGILVGLILFCWFLLGSKLELKVRWLIPFVFIILIFPYLFFLKQYTSNWQISGKTYANLVLGELKSPYQNLQSVSNTNIPRYRIIESIWNDPSQAKTITEYLNEPENDIVQRIPKNLKDLFLVYWYGFSVIGIILIFMGLFNTEPEKRFFLLSLFLPMTVYLIFFILQRTVAIYHGLCIILITTGFIEMERLLEIKLVKYKRLILGLTIAVLCLYQSRSVLKIMFFS